ncbi:MAG: UDP-N-acetylmuramate dehydrogenase [Blastocatellia bacterium]|nr:UDP-N-acetylmuramate dehydrogenase [Blastocatellia bacterium]MCS7157981.1 UDP-N-acetylmuramate dehydrogenase [Blastocatellia bacterium]MCX7752488.1 UDP-N-acetylmuramate dehydrogenase [Blastocatellia bacterium]MDW8167397.1 UDP-N-acetylmuramate dehydrogenase [Acidobacteriota bacterium]MDW8257425.1 UDP-N-acetylmuramate dehydrogenase [Acidobacteriota bacterium]
MKQDGDMARAAACEFARAFEARLGSGRLRSQEPLAPYVNWRVGGPAEWFFIARTRADLIAAASAAREANLPVTILGYGANVLVADAGVRGLVILNRAESIEICGEEIWAESGVNLVALARRAGEAEIGGFEFLIGIPGTLGGAIVGNAGTREEWIGERVREVEVLDERNDVVVWPRAQLDFGYRRSRFQRTSEVILAARLKGYRASRSSIEAKMRCMLEARKHQPSGPSAGSVFKNPPGDYAGRLIEACGLKGYRLGGAKISEQHANFILNVGGATAREIRALIERAKVAVYERFGILLEEEIRYVGVWDV